MRSKLLLSINIDINCFVYYKIDKSVTNTTLRVYLPREANYDNKTNFFFQALKKKLIKVHDIVKKSMKCVSRQSKCFSLLAKLFQNVNDFEQSIRTLSNEGYNCMEIIKVCHYTHTDTHSHEGKFIHVHSHVHINAYSHIHFLLKLICLLMKINM